MSEQTDGLIKHLFSLSAVNPQKTYYYQFRDTFYALVPSAFKPYYYEVIRRCVNWYSGYVPEVHRTDTGVFSTGIGNIVVKEISKLIMGGKLFARNKGEEFADQDKANPTLDRFVKWDEFYNFQNTVQQFIEFTAAGGTGCLKSNINESGDLQPRPLRADQFFYQTDFKGEVISWTGFLKSYSADSNRVKQETGKSENFYLVEKRYFQEETWIPMMKVVVKRDFGQVNSGQTFDDSDLKEYNWDQLPQTIRMSIQRDYGKDFRINEPEKLPFDDLGVDLAHFTVSNRTPEVVMGEPALLNVLSLLWDYDYSFSSMVTDQYIGRGKVLVPRELTNPSSNAQTFYEGFDSSVFTKMPMANADNQKPMSIQFDLRSKDWEKQRNIIAENIASHIGVSGSDMFPFLRDATGSKTATQIASESQKTLSFTEEKRRIFLSALNRFIQRWRKHHDGKDDFTLRFSSQNMVNKLVTIEEVRVMKEVCMSRFDTFQSMFPSMDEYQVWQMVKRSKKEEKERLELQAEINTSAFENRAKNINGNPAPEGIKEKDEIEPDEE